MRKTVLNRLADLFRWKRPSSPESATCVPSAADADRKRDDAWLLEPERDLSDCRNDHRVEMQMLATGLRDMRHRLAGLALRDDEDSLWQPAAIGSPVADEHDLFDGGDIPILTVQDTTIGGVDDLLFDAPETSTEAARYAA